MKQRKRAKQRQERGLVRLMDATQRLGLYDAELEGLLVRRTPNARTRRAIRDAREGRTTPVPIDEL